MKTIYIFMFFSVPLHILARPCTHLVDKQTYNLCISIHTHFLSNKKYTTNRSYLIKIARFISKEILTHKLSFSLVAHDASTLFYPHANSISPQDIYYVKILLATSLIDHTQHNTNQFVKDSEWIKLRPTDFKKLDFEKSIAVELSLPPYRYGYTKVKKILPHIRLWAFENERDHKIYVMQENENQMFTLYLYLRGVLNQAHHFCRDKNFMLALAHKNKIYDQYQVCFRYNGKRAWHASAAQVCFDHIHKGEQSPFGMGSGYDSFDVVGVARGFEHNLQTPSYYCQYDFFELMSHGFTDLLPFIRQIIK